MCARLDTTGLLADVVYAIVFGDERQATSAFGCTVARRAAFG